MSSPIAVIDFETTGMTPGQGARATEVAIVLLEDGQVVDRFQSLMRTGVWIPPFITRLTGITNAMVAAAPAAEEVMRDAARFVGAAPMVAHNAAFDRRFWEAELAQAGLQAPQPFACTVLLSRRLYPEAPSHKLGNIVDHLGLPRAGRAHRALADAEMAASLLARMQHDLRLRWGLGQTGHGVLSTLQRCPKGQMARLLAQQAAQYPLTRDLFGRDGELLPQDAAVDPARPIIGPSLP
ncbi:3'-5' exonuclease [Comamonas endophytica]|uniref:3'-5' exonuclease n=1 Tax=Comamonas endophytica TaxID=2949090 RepID=A0ABY6GDJ3_9BURK|nr:MULTISPECIES: 3'-5' exonuclease [unclassified Acidovorax]MCD2512475.1 3'-5' exonuclease [Acidovorax sp. D4N7]UYG53156.1 3'-5' exonuclease [Acidovorax sp. 5MLIR]